MQPSACQLADKRTEALGQHDRDHEHDDKLLQPHQEQDQADDSEQDQAGPQQRRTCDHLAFWQNLISSSTASAEVLPRNLVRRRPGCSGTVLTGPARELLPPVAQKSSSNHDFESGAGERVSTPISDFQGGSAPARVQMIAAARQA